MNRRCLALSVLAALWLAGRAAATTYVVVPDERLADEATVVVDGTVEAVRGVPGAAPPMTEYVVRVERTLKGRVTDGSVSVRVLGGRRADGKRLHVWGAPALQPGERALLFLVAHDDGAFRPLHFGLGAFHEARRSGRALALRDLGQAQVLAPDGRETLDRVRDFDGFSRWVADRSAGLRRAQDYFVDLPAGPSRAVEPFTFLGGEPHRWFEFDGSQSISWRAHQNGQPGVAGGGFAEFQAAINAWNADAGSNVRYRYDGTTTATAGFEDFDGVNAILFEDPNNEIGGAFACTVPGNGSGTLAIGGAWSEGKRNDFLIIAGGDIVMNDGVGCWFVNGKRAEQVYGHELGHTLGLGHSCGDEGKPCNSNLLRDALMRATAHRDDRGARLNDDDRAGIRFLYPQSGGNPGGNGGKPAAPSGLTAVTQSASSVLLAWTDNANNETNYRVERKTNGGWTQLPLLPAGSTSFTVTGLTAATSYTFRVRAKNSSGFSGYSNEAAATTQAGLPAAPAGLTAERIAGDQIRLAWQDRSGNETAFAVEVTSPFHAGFVEIATAAANATTYVVSHLDADVPYTFRVRARNANGNSAPTNLASATIPAPVACGTVSSDLCLLGGRFRVFVHWKLGNGQIGDATAVPDSDQTGFFYFFGQENIELIVKILDARTINQAFWTFYGGLSDVEYWVSVIDTVTGDSATYRNAPGNLCGRADVGAFPQSASTSLEALALDPAAEPLVLAEAPATATTEAACAPGTLCLFGGRFQVEATFEKDGATQKATAVPYGDGSGFFWFFSSANTELVAKVIDGRGINGKFWFFYGALSDVKYDIKVTDTATGAVKTYHNAQGNLCGRADTTAF